MLKLKKKETCCTMNYLKDLTLYILYNVTKKLFSILCFSRAIKKNKEKFLATSIKTKNRIEHMVDTFNWMSFNYTAKFKNSFIYELN